MSKQNNKPYNLIFKEKNKLRRETIISTQNSTPYLLTKQKKKSWAPLSKYQRRETEKKQSWTPLSKYERK